MKNQQYSSSLIPLEEDEGAGWLATFADLATLLLVFFILLFSISSLNLEKFKAAVRSIQVNLGEELPAIGILDVIDNQAEQKVSIEEITGLRSREQEIIDGINEFIEEKRLGEHIILKTFKEKIVILIKGRILFKSGSAELNRKSFPILDKIVDIIDKYPEYYVNIKGYTDNVPISTNEFPSNWELSAIRATTVLKYLIKNDIEPDRLTATGYGDLAPIAPNDTEENRTKNRRVEFILKKISE